MMDPIWKLVILLLGLWMLAKAGLSFSHEQGRCAFSMTITKRVVFETTTTDSKGNKVYNMTEYIFLDNFVCSFEGFTSEFREVYRCTTGNIVLTTTVIWDQRTKVLNREVITCRTQQLPTIEPNSIISFECDDTELVQPSIACNVLIGMHTYCIISPIRLDYPNQCNVNRMVSKYSSFKVISHFGGYAFESEKYFHSYLTSCSGILLVRKEKATAETGVLYQMLKEFLGHHIHPQPSSLEITNNASPHLPDIICKYKNLQQLSVEYNKYKILPTCLHKLTKLKILDAAFNALESINEVSFGSEQPKTYLDLSFNKIKHVKKSAFSKLTNLVFLSLANNSLTELNFYFPEYLTHLDLSHNKIKHISPSQTFLQQNKIERLFLQYNGIKTIDFSMPSSLMFLDLSHNQLKSIDLEELNKMKYLKEVHLDYNQITELKENILHRSKEITILPNLEGMNISHNQLTVAPLSLIFLNKMREIDFSHNRIENCTWSDMPIEHILKNIDEKVPRSCISEYSYNKDRQRNMINLKHNKIRSLKDVFNRTLIMSHRYATLFCHVLLEHNPFHCDCKMYPYLRALHDLTIQASKTEENDNPMIRKEINSALFKWNINYLGSCHSQPNMKSNMVMDINILDKLTCNLLPKEKCKYIFKPSGPLLIVNCSNLKLTEIPQSNNTSALNESLALTLYKLGTENHIPNGIDTNLLLNGNNFGKIHRASVGGESFPFIIGTLANFCLKELDFSHSNIIEIDDMLLIGFTVVNHHLIKIFLNNNNLTNLPLEMHILYYENEKYNVDRKVPFWKNLVELHLYSNPWDCSCGAKWMSKWLNDLIARKVLVRPDEIKCATPEWNQNKTVYLLDEKDFCDTPQSLTVNLLFLVGIFLLTTLLGLILGFIILYYNNAYMSKTILEQVPPSRDNIVNDHDVRGMLYDAFVSYCEADSTWVEQELIPSLRPSYKICDHKRHFVAGMTSQWNEFNAIRHSRRTIIIMSNSYLEREHCMYEFTAAWLYWIYGKKNPRLVVVKYPDVDIENHSELCTDYFRHFTYLAKDEHTFERLVEFMPRESLAQNAAITDGTGPSSLNQDGGLSILLKTDKEQTERSPESYAEELRSEDERYARLWQEAEFEAAERNETGEDILAEEIFIQKLDSKAKQPHSEEETAGNRGRPQDHNPN